MTIFVISNHLPSKSHTWLGAVTMVHYHAVMELLRRGHRVVLQCITQIEDRRPLTAEERATIGELEEQGVTVLPLCFRSDYLAPLKGSWEAWLPGRLRSWFSPLRVRYPAVRLRPLIGRRIAETGAEVVLIFWNPEGVAVTYRNHRVPKFVYYGMPDHLTGLAKVEHPHLFGLTLNGRQRAAWERELHRLERCHLSLMKDCDVVANLCAEHADYYARRGHPRSLYLQNMWPASSNGSADDPAVPSPRGGGKPKIVGGLGTWHATGNTFGLKFLGEEIVPRLTRRLGPDGFDIHIFGLGQLRGNLRDLLEVPGVKLRGWVEDIDAEIRSADIFLVTNNAGPYKGSHTRFLHAWSLGVCCVAHRYNATAMPELVHGENILLGETADEIVEELIRALQDPLLRRRIADGGRATFEAHFRPEVVVGRMLEEMESLVARKAVGAHDH